MRNQRSPLSWSFLVLFLLTNAALAVEPFWRTFYLEDERVKTEKGKNLMSDAYGANLFFMSWNDEKPPKEPQRKKGVVVHDDPDDDGEILWVEGDSNPHVMCERMKNKYITPKYGNISDKWFEYKFLTSEFPKLAPPEMRLASDFMDGDEARDEISKIAGEAEAVLKEVGVAHDAKLVETLTRIELVRQRIIDRMNLDVAKKERAVMKNRVMNHSEGKLPKTDKNWMKLYATYVKEDKKAVDAFLSKGGEGSFQEFLVDRKQPEGYALETMLAEFDAIKAGTKKDEDGKTINYGPEDCEIIVQKMIPLHREVRMHIVNGKIVENATFLRFYHLNEYLPAGEKRKIEEAIEEHFLPNLAREHKRWFCATPDVVIEEGTGHVRILDFNDGIQSGYYFPDEDLFTTNYLAKHLSGGSTVFLDEIERIYALDPVKEGDQKVELLRGVLKKYHPFMTGDVLEAFWDRIQGNYREWVRDARGENRKAMVLASLDQFKAAGLKEPTIYFQFLADIFESFPALEADLKAFKPELEKMVKDKKLDLVVEIGERGRLLGVEGEEARDRRKAKKFAQQRSRQRAHMSPMAKAKRDVQLKNRAVKP